MKKVLFLVVSVFCFQAGLFSQSGDSARPKEKIPLNLFSFADPHNPVKAGIYSTVIPGLGQIYNRKYWKAPIVYAALGGATWFMLDQRSVMRNYNTRFRELYADSLTPSPYDIAARDQARQYRDFAILAMSAVYVLQIVDATVDAHFYKFDIDQSLEARLSPNPARAFRLTYRF